MLDENRNPTCSCNFGYELINGQCLKGRSCGFNEKSDSKCYSECDSTYYTCNNGWVNGLFDDAEKVCVKDSLYDLASKPECSTKTVSFNSVTTDKRCIGVDSNPKCITDCCNR